MTGRSGLVHVVGGSAMQAEKFVGTYRWMPVLPPCPHDCRQRRRCAT